MTEEITSPEWTTEDWHKAWNITVGSVYECEDCNSLVMVIKGGTGTLAPRCCGKPMKLVEKQ